MRSIIPRKGVPAADTHQARRPSALPLETCGWGLGTVGESLKNRDQEP